MPKKRSKPYASPRDQQSLPRTFSRFRGIP